MELLDIWLSMKIIGEVISLAFVVIVIIVGILKAITDQ